MVHVLALVIIQDYYYWFGYYLFGLVIILVIIQELSSNVTSYQMEQGLSDGTGYINWYLACWKFTCQLHFDNTCTSSDSFEKLVNICLEN